MARAASTPKLEDDPNYAARYDMMVAFHAARGETLEVARKDLEIVLGDLPATTQPDNLIVPSKTQRRTKWIEVYRLELGILLFGEKAMRRREWNN